MEQIETMNITERLIRKYIKEPSDLDMERYDYYIENGMDKSMIAPLPEAQFDVFYAYISDNLKNQSCMKEISESIRDDVIKDYDYSMRKSILDYVLLNNEERKRVKIEWVPRPFILKYLTLRTLAIKYYLTKFN